MMQTQVTPLQNPSPVPSGHGALDWAEPAPCRSFGSFPTDSGPSRRAEAPRCQDATQVPVLVRTGLATQRRQRGWIGDAGDAEWIGREALHPAQVFEAGLEHHHLANTAYPIAHRKTIWPYRQRRGHARLLQTSLRAAGRMGLYVHIPFCEKRCSFCEYTVINGHDELREAAYHEALMRELELYLELFGQGTLELVGLDIGGGTPALVRPHRLEQLLDRIRRGFRLAPDFSVSIETTPRVAATDPGRMRALRQLGIDRISMGLQMINPRLLREYGRELNSVGYNKQAVDNIRQAGFARFNIDLMYGLARQSLADFGRALEYTIALDPEYITLYRMRYKGTRVSHEARQVELERVMTHYQEARRLLLAAGYQANPGKNGFSRVDGDPGTSAYLTERVEHGTPYLGLGLGAQTFTGNLLAYNLGAASKRLGHYLQATAAGRLPIQDLYHLPLAEGMAKMISVSFYFGQIQLESFRARFGVALQRCFAREVAFLLQRGLMEHRGSTLRLTPRGAENFNGVIALFYSDRVKQHLVELGARNAERGGGSTERGAGSSERGAGSSERGAGS